MKYLALIISTLALLTLLTATVYSQGKPSGVAISIPITDEDAVDGSIISSSGEGYILTSTPYDPTIFGVITEDPSVYIENINLTDTKPVITSGKAYVRVSTINGAISVNDFVTSSEIPGVAQKATINGFILGTYLESYSEVDSNEIVTILISVNPQFTSSFLGINRNQDCPDLI